MKGNTHDSTVSLIRPPFSYLCLCGEAKTTNTKQISMEDPCREIIKLRENTYRLVMHNLIERIMCKNVSGSICSFEKTKKAGVWGGSYTKGSFMCITKTYFK